MNERINIGFCVTGSFCTLNKLIKPLKELVDSGANVQPIFSASVYKTDTRFGDAVKWIKEFEEITGNKVWNTVKEAEPIGPKNLMDITVVAPCTGNTLTKIAMGITDTAPSMAVKATLRNGRPIVLAVSTNDGLSNCAKNIGALMNSKNIFFVPFSQDDPINKPTSLVAHFDELTDTIQNALRGMQIQPLLKMKKTEP